VTLLSGPMCGHEGEGGLRCDMEACHVGHLHSMKAAHVDGELVEVYSWGDDGVVTRTYFKGKLEDTEGRIY
jgi:hypothetical protein